MLLVLGQGYQRRKSPTISFLVVLLIRPHTFPAGSFPVAAAEDLLDRVQNEDLEQVIKLRVGHSKVLRTPFPIQRVSVADPDIADIVTHLESGNLHQRQFRRRYQCQSLGQTAVSPGPGSQLNRISAS